MKIQNKKLFTNLIVSGSILFVIFVVSLVLFLLNVNTSRKVFVFESLDDTELHIEVRHLKNLPKNEQIALFIDDLLLGPVHDRYRPIFPTGTKVESIIQRGHTLYVNLSEEAILQKDTSSQTKIACDLFRKNIFTNYGNINEVVLFINGIEVYTIDNSENLFWKNNIS